MPYGAERDEPIRRSESKPRGITERLAKIAQPTRTVLDEPGPETNRDPGAQGSPPGAQAIRFGGGGEPVEATRTEPGGVAVVEVPGELDRPDDDSRVAVDGETGQPELVERESIQPGDQDREPRGFVGDETGRGGGSPAGGAGAAAGGSVARAGTPGTIEPPLDPRPATLLELADVVTPEPAGPWPAGTFVTYGSGKRASWNGEAWRSGEAPG